MRKILLTIVVFTSWTFSEESSNIDVITRVVKERMIKGKTWHQGCPVALEDLRYLQIPYWGFDQRVHHGELIVHKSVASEVIAIFKQLYNLHYPIKQMRLASDYNGNDDLSMKANNTSAFNCRLMTGSLNKWSKHSFGKAIDINPLQNPYIAKKGRVVLPKEGQNYIGNKRKHSPNSVASKAIILEDDPIVELFNYYGWKWGGSWRTLKDYQHFEKVFTQEKNKKPLNGKREKKVSPKSLFKSLQNMEANKELF